MMYFKEKQTFWSFWLLIIMLFLVYATIDFRVAEILKADFSNVQITVAFGGILLILIFFISVRLKTEIDEQGIKIDFFPFLWETKHISWSEVHACYLRTYSPIGEYGGWGYRTGAFGKAYNTKGKVGLQLIFKDGKKLLIGTQKETELAAVIAKYRPQNSNL